MQGLKHRLKILKWHVAHMRRELHTEFLLGKLKGKIPHQDLDIDEKIVLKWILKK